MIWSIVKLSVEEKKWSVQIFMEFETREKNNKDYFGFQITSKWWELNDALKIQKAFPDGIEIIRMN